MPRPSTLPSAARALVLGGAALVASSLFSASAARAQALFRLPNHVPAVIAASKKLGPVSPASKVTVLLSLPLRDEAGLKTLLTGLYNPKSPLYGRYLTPDEFTARFAPSQSDYDAVVAFAKSQRLTVQTYDSRVLVSVSGTTAAVQAALSTHLNNYKAKDGTAFFGPDVDPGIPAALAGKISGVLGLNNYAKLKPLFRTATPGQIAAGRALVPRVEDVARPPADFGGGTGHGGAFAPKDLRTAYDLNNLPVDGTGQSLGLYEEGGFFPEDVDRYKDYYKLPDVPITVVPVDGFSGAVSDLGVSEEAALDIDMALALAPGLREVRVYESPLNYPQGLIDALNLAAKENVSKQFSISYGLAEEIVGLPVIQAENTQLKRLAAEGTTVFASSGDQGAYTDYITPAAVSDPASQPLITAVGGTALYTAPGGAYLGETSWNELGLFGAAGGGGVSEVWSIPAYQTSIDPTANGGSATMRNVPDVALDAAILTGVDVYSTAAGGWSDFGGTSVSSPLWAAYTARVNQARREAGLKPLGFANPALYAIGSSFLAFFDFHDVIDGTNGNTALFGSPGFTTGFGYDDVTGFGSFDGAQMLGDLGAAPSSTTAAPPAAPTYFKGVPGNNQVTLIWKASKNARGYYVFRAPSPNSSGFLAATKSLSYVDKTAKNGVLYEYVLEAVGDGGGTAASYPIYVKPSATPGE